MIRPVVSLVCMAAIFAAVPAHAADRVTGAMQEGYARLSFTLDPNAHVSATTTGGVLAIAFGRKAGLDAAAVTAAMPRFITGGHADADGATLRFTVSQPIRVHVSQQGDRAVVDLADANFAGALPDLPPPVKAVPKPVDPNSLPEVKLRVGAYSNFTRLVFDWPKSVPYSVFPGAGKMTVRFQALARPDLSALTRFAPPWVKNAAWHIDGNAILVEFETDSDSGFHDFKDGSHMVLDILAPKTDGGAYTPPGTAKPGVTAMTAAPKGVTSAQAQAIADTAQKLAPRPVTPPKPDAKAADSKTAAVKPADAKTPDTKTPDTKTADAKPVAAAPADASSAQVTKDGAVLHFPGAGAHPSAVFIRGLTAWIVLENSPSLEAARLQAALGNFAQQVEAVSSNGLSILRLTLKSPEGIAATVYGADLKVAIGPRVESDVMPIGFSRDQSDRMRASLTALLPAADHAFQVPDPATGDILTIIPAAPGRALPAMRAFVDFAALPSASGLVITPYTDDLAISVDNSRVIIARAGGLSLTPPQMPSAQSPAALAGMGDGPTFLDFANWNRMEGGSFLNTERQMTANIGHAFGPGQAAARLKLARFYLANGFAPEALGLIDLIQKSDPGLQGDAQLTTMRAAAEYMMARYRDSHNELAGAAFDNARHAALWRGLAETALEDFHDAHDHLDQADEVLNRYPAYWQAEAHLADAEASLGMGRLDLAEAALVRMPKALTPRQAGRAELLGARVSAGESRYADAAPHFVALEKSGDEMLQAQAIYYHTSAALAAGAISPPQAIETLERLRFRWRGDGLELSTLRKLASLYFARSQWQDGFKTLKVAVQNFATADAARQAQDEMRGAFVNLFLKGGADKMKPVDALALFYDNVDLTPIGPDGDEMIRRICDRLVAVDLLGPAANLLAYQVDKRLDGIARAQVSTKLAAIYLMDHKPEAAVKAVHDSNITGLPDDEMHRRMIVEARAFAALKQWDNALDLIAVDQAQDTRRLRADIYWESGNWAVAGQKTEELLDTRWSDATPLADSDRAEVLRAAVAYSLANDQTSLGRLRAHFTPKMKSTPDANLFTVLAASIDDHGLAFRDAATKIAAIDTLESFMKDFTRRYQDQPRS